MTAGKITQTAAPSVPQGTKAQQIVEAARQVFMAQGYGAASMDAIARAAGVSKATVYAYFPGKEALFEAIIAAECRRRSRAFQPPGTAPRDVRADLLEFGHCLAELMLSPGALSIYRVVVAEAPRFPELGRIFYESGPNAVLTGLTAYFEEATARGLLRVPNPRLAAEQFVGMVRGGAYLRRLLGLEPDSPDPDMARRVAGAADLILCAYGPDGPTTGGPADNGPAAGRTRADPAP